LTDANGVVLSGTYELTFNLYDGGDNLVWGPEEHKSVEVNNGIFNVILGSVTPLAPVSFNKQYWLGVTVEGEDLPLIKLTSSPYSLSARSLRLPFAQIGSTDESTEYNALFMLNNSGTAFAGSFVNSGTGSAGEFRIPHTLDNSSPALKAETYGTGEAGHFEIFYPNNPESALYAKTAGTGRAGHFQIDNISNDKSALYAATNGTGNAGYFNGNVVVTDNIAIGMPYTPMHNPSSGIVMDVNGNINIKGISDGEDDLDSQIWLGATRIRALKASGLEITPEGVHSGLFIAEITGNVGIGTKDPQAHLHVDGDAIITGEIKSNGKISATEIEVTETVPIPDFVFEDDYDLMSLDELEKSIEKNKHLPDIPSAEEIAANGMNVGEMQAKLLQKVEELTLYVIELKKENEQLKRRIDSLEN
jgi:hypothetical protein